jgi:hypothetical protein
MQRKKGEIIVHKNDSAFFSRLLGDREAFLYPRKAKIAAFGAAR